VQIAELTKGRERGHDLSSKSEIRSEGDWCHLRQILGDRGRAEQTVIPMPDDAPQLDFEKAVRIPVSRNPANGDNLSYEVRQVPLKIRSAKRS